MAILTATSEDLGAQALLGDFDRNGRHDIRDVVGNVRVAQEPGSFTEIDLNVMDLDWDGNVDTVDVDLLVSVILGELSPEWAPVSRLERLSPANGEVGVAITRETILRLSSPLDSSSLANISEAINARLGGETLGARVHVSSDGRVLTLFYDEDLPPSSRVTIKIDGDRLVDAYGQSVDVDNDGIVGGVEEFSFETLTLTSFPGTVVCGRVFASEVRREESGDETISVNTPLAGVTITVDGMEDTLRVVTDELGNFRLENAPVGEFFVHIDGRTAESPVEGAYYPFVGKTWKSVLGKEVNLDDIYLPLVLPGTLQEVSATEDTAITFADAVLEERPELEGVNITVPPNSLYADDGTLGGQVGIAPVDPERLPGPLPDDLEFPLVITVQTDGATNFDIPVPVCFPNLPDPVTGETLGPGEETVLWSFNHDTGRFEIVGSMTISEDGRFACSDPGVGILAPGWHAASPRPATIADKMKRRYDAALDALR